MRKYLILIGLILTLVALGIYFSSRQDNAVLDLQTNNNSLDKSNLGYDLKITSIPENIIPNEPTKIVFVIVNEQDEVVKDYTISHEKIMHFILVRKDLQGFQHLHPDFNQSTGEFSLDVTFPTDGPYRIYPDFIPTPDNPEKQTVTLSKDISVGDLSKYQAQPLTADTENSKSENGFNIDYYFGSIPRVEAQIDYSLTISKPNINEQVQLEPYLGAMGHSVIIKEGSLDFIHTHALGMDMGDMEGMSAAEHAGHSSEPDTADFSTKFSEKGKYKIFTQFQVYGNVITTDYVIEVN